MFLKAYELLDMITSVLEEKKNKATLFIIYGKRKIKIRFLVEKRRNCTDEAPSMVAAYSKL